VAIGVSEYNRQELERTGFERTGVVPLLWDRARLDLPPDEVVLKLFVDDRTNFLFVGRIMPNKCIEDVIQVFHLYQKHWDRRSRLLLVGDPGILDRYFLSLQRHVERLGVRNVVFAGHVTTAELAAYYELADVFLCLSEHEGFCLPLLEAFGFGVPVMAFEAGGVPEALGGAGILIREKRFDDIAAMAHLLVHDEGFRSRVVERELGVLEEIERRDDAGKLLSFAQEALESGVTSEPRGPSA
jgi:glycosyltransferase involved in cell wall biosynthesis